MIFSLKLNPTWKSPTSCFMMTMPDVVCKYLHVLTWQWVIIACTVLARSSKSDYSMFVCAGGLIPLHNASSFGHMEVVTLLLSHRGDPNARDNWSFTPLHEAAIKGKVDVCISKFKE